jgi:hypothetical protein
MMIFQESIASFARTMVPLFGNVPFGSVFYAMAYNTADDNKDIKIKTSIIENKNIRAASEYPHDDTTMDCDNDMMYFADGFTSLPDDDTTMDCDNDMIDFADGSTSLPDDEMMDCDDDMMDFADGFTSLPDDEMMDCDDDMMEGTASSGYIYDDAIEMDEYMMEL